MQYEGVFIGCNLLIQCTEITSSLDMVHGGIDGYSRLVVFLKCSTNNLASIVLSSFLEGTESYGVPTKVRSDHGGGCLAFYVGATC